MPRKRATNEDDHEDQPVELALVGELADCEAEVSQKLLEVEPGGQCTLYIDSPGGSPYSGMAIMTLMVLRELRVTGIVTGECSSSALWPLAACVQRLVTPFSVLLFHPMKWQSDENVGLSEASEWARHFAELERSMDRLLAEHLGVDQETLDQWMRPGRYVSGVEFAAAGLADLVELPVRRADS